MGQYWLIINLTKKQYILAYRYKSGSKLMEFSWMENPYIKALQTLISPGGLWHGDKIWIEGDYNDPNPDVDPQNNIYSLARQSWKEISVQGLPTNKKFAINLTKKCFVKIEKYNEKKFKIHPLPLLLACSSGSGGGDYNGRNMQNLGKWVGDIVYTDDTVPIGFEQFKPSFYEGMSDEEDDEKQQRKEVKKQQRKKFSSFFEGGSDDEDQQDEDDDEQNEQINFWEKSFDEQSDESEQSQRRKKKKIEKKDKTLKSQIARKRKDQKKREISHTQKRSQNQRERSRDKQKKNRNEKSIQKKKKIRDN